MLLCRTALLFLVKPCPQVVHTQVCLSVFTSLIMQITYLRLVSQCSRVLHCAASSDYMSIGHTSMDSEKPSPIHKPLISRNDLSIWSASFEGFSNPFHIIKLSKKAVMSIIIIQQDKKQCKAYQRS